MWVSSLRLRKINQLNDKSRISVKRPIKPVAKFPFSAKWSSQTVIIVKPNGVGEKSNLLEGQKTGFNGIELTTGKFA